MRALERYRVLDATRDEVFDTIAGIASSICNAPLALVAFVGADELWVKNSILDVHRFPREGSFAAHAILQDDLLVVRDASVDQRFASHPLVASEPFVRFCVAAPLLTPDGYGIGALTVMDTVARDLSANQLDALRVMASQVITRLELRRNAADLADSAAARLDAEAELRRSEARNTAILESALDCIITANEEGRILQFNSAAERVFGYRRADVVGKALADVIIPPSLREAHRAGIARFVATRKGNILDRRIEVTAMRSDGSEFPAELAVTAVEGRDGVLFMGTLRDISDRKLFEQQLRETEARYRDLVERVPAIVYSAAFGEEGAWDYVSPQIETMLGFSPEEWMADPALWFKQIHPEDRESAVAQENQSRISGRPLVSEYRLVSRDGKAIWVRDEAVVMRDEAGEPVSMQGVILDISKRKELEQQLTYSAFHDSLTHLPNRALFMDRVEHALARSSRFAQPVTVLFLDLDEFKTINDSLGHIAGDELLKSIASRLQAACRETDTIARFGGDEFAILLEETDTVNASIIAQRVLQELQNPLIIQGKEVRTSASVGIAGSIDEDAEDLLRNADVAMYDAKGRGKGRFTVFQPDMHSKALQRLELQGELQRALATNEFVLYYQPIVDLRTGAIVEAEALLRWFHPKLGLVPPLDFIPLAEDTGLIVPMGGWVLKEAARQARAWRAKYGDVHAPAISVNLSPRQLHQPDIVDQVDQALNESKLPPGSLILEITESVLMTDREVTTEKLHELRDLGVKIAIDDFGTGYSSLSYLRHFPIDILKIDKSFVDGVCQGPEESAVAHAIVQLGQILHLQTVAEGVESSEQVDALLDFGASLGQGYFFSRPVEGQELGNLLGSELPVRASA